MTHNDVERERYEARLEGLRDQAANLTSARQEGRDEGPRQGREEGKLPGQIRFSQLLLKQPQTLEEELALLSPKS